MSNQSSAAKLSQSDQAIPNEEPPFKPNPDDPHPIKTAMYFSRNEITFSIDNTKNGFDLVADKATFADWGDFSSSPSNISPWSNGEGGKVISSHSPFTGSAGMIGYSLNSPGESRTLYVRLAATNPYLSWRDNRCMVKTSFNQADVPIDGGGYNGMYHNSGNAEVDFAGKKLKITSTIGSADSATAKFFFDSS